MMNVKPIAAMSTLAAGIVTDIEGIKELLVRTSLPEYKEHYL